MLWLVPFPNLSIPGPRAVRFPFQVLAGADVELPR